jgi:hypothetical protein
VQKTHQPAVGHPRKIILCSLNFNEPAEKIARRAIKSSSKVFQRLAINISASISISRCQSSEDAKQAFLSGHVDSIIWMKLTAGMGYANIMCFSQAKLYQFQVR